MMALRNLQTRTAMSALAVTGALFLSASIGTSAAADYDNPSTKSATGTFALKTGPGIQPAWDAEDITISAISPGSMTALTSTATSTIYLPIVAKTGTANATAGGFKLTNSATRETVRCLIPTVDTRARAIDCLLDSGYNSTIFSIESIGDRNFLSNQNFKTSIFTDMKIKIISSEMASVLNDALSTNVFTDSVIVANANLTVSRRTASQ